MFGHTFEGGFYFFSFYPDYNYLFLLIVVVLFLQTWNTIRLNFGAKSLKLMFISAAVIIGVSFAFSKINLIDYKAFNKMVFSHKIEKSYNYELPESDSYIELKNKYLINRFYFVEDTITKRPIIIKDNKEITFKEIPREISSFKNYISEYEITYQLHIHKDIKMKFVNPIVKEFSASGSRIGFAVIPRGNNNKYNIINYSITKRYGQYNKGFDDETQQKVLSKFKNKITIEQNEDGTFVMNNELASEERIIKVLKNEMKKNPEKYIVLLRMDLEATFSSYIKILSLLRVSAFEVRNAYSLSEHLTKFESLKREQKREVYDKFPIRVFESFKY